MILTPEKSLCEKNQAIVVSRDKGNQRQHRGINPQRSLDLRQYRLDGDLFCYTKCCDFLLLDDTKRNAYFIELKGSNVDEAVAQLEAGEQMCRAELSGYECYYRIVHSKARTHTIKNPTFRKFKEKCGSRLRMGENILEEIL